MFNVDGAFVGDLIYICGFGLGGLAFALAPFAVVHLLAARKTRNYGNKTGQFVECGMDPIGDAWIRYSAVYYLYALVFVRVRGGCPLPHPGGAGLWTLLCH